MVAVFIFTFSLAESYVFLCHLLFISSVSTDIKPVKKTQYLFISGVTCHHVLLFQILNTPNSRGLAGGFCFVVLVQFHIGFRIVTNIIAQNSGKELKYNLTHQVITQIIINSKECVFYSRKAKNVFFLRNGTIMSEKHRMLYIK